MQTAQLSKILNLCREHLATKHIRSNNLANYTPSSVQTPSPVTSQHCSSSRAHLLRSLRREQRFKDPSSYCASSNNALNGNPNHRQPRNALLETHLPMTEETTENFLRRGMGRSELQPGKRRSEGNSLEEGEEAAAGGSSSAAALGGWTGLGCRSAGQVFDASGWRSAAAAVYSVRGGGER